MDGRRLREATGKAGERQGENPQRPRDSIGRDTEFTRTLSKEGNIGSEGDGESQVPKHTEMGRGPAEARAKGRLSEKLEE